MIYVHWRRVSGAPDLDEAVLNCATRGPSGHIAVLSIRFNLPCSFRRTRAQCTDVFPLLLAHLVSKQGVILASEINNQFD